MGSVAVKGRLPLADSQDSEKSAAQASISSNHFEVPFRKTIGTSDRPICITPRISPACWSNVASRLILPPAVSTRSAESS